MVYRVYVIQSESGKFYIGLSEDVAERLAQHNSGVSKWTRGKGPWKLAWSSEEMSLGDARKLENELKRQKGGIGFFALTGLKPRGGS
jgi:predicted GIY-YIG superfamily endonuclease